MTLPPNPPPGVTLRRARPDDAESFAALMNDPLVYPGTLQLPHVDAAFWRERLKEPGGSAVSELHLVALHEGRVIGSAGLLPASPAVRRRHAMHLGIVIAGPWQGQGIGHLMMAVLCDHADRWLGALRIELTVYADNARAIALYRRHGFVEEGRLRAYALRDGVYVDTLAMARLHPNPPRLDTAP